MLLLRGRLLFVFFALRDAWQTLCKHLSYLVEKKFIWPFKCVWRFVGAGLLALLVFALGVPVKA
jgi:hypothetical protein